MRSSKSVMIILLIGILIVGQAAYFLVVYSEDKMEINMVASELEDTKRYLKQLQERVEMLPETKKELELMTAQKVALLNTIPLFESDSRQMAEFMRYIELKDVIDIYFNKLDPNEKYEDESIHVSSYELSFVGRYKDVRDFVDAFNASYQIINITELIIDNAIQEDNKGSEGKNDRLLQHFGIDLPQVVDATIRFKMYSRVNKDDIDEIYTPEYSMQLNSENIFARVNQKNPQKDQQQVSPTLDTSKDKSQQSVNKVDSFTLNVGDMFTSGDTYKFGGPGESGYVGLISQVNTEIKLIVSESGYKIYMKDANGQAKEAEVNMPLKNINLDIISTMREIRDVMPSVHIYVYNYTPSIMNIKLSGSMLDNIHIFNEDDNRVRIGQTKGNIKVG